MSAKISVHRKSCYWIVNGCPEEHFLTVLHVKYGCRSNHRYPHIIISQKNLDYRKLVGQGYDGAATFSGNRTGVQARMKVHAARALYIHCSCHRLQLASTLAADAVGTVRRMFGTMTNLWKLFYYSPQKAEALKNVQSVLCMPELKALSQVTHDGCHMSDV